MVFPVVTFRCESWITIMAECWRIDTWELVGNAEFGALPTPTK